MSKETEIFFELLRAGLWEREAHCTSFEGANFDELFRITKEQSMFGPVVAGMEHVEDRSAIKQHIRPFASKVVKIEKRNTLMNKFIGVLFEKMRAAGILAMLVKGQGIAQCYAKPMYRASGDVDLLLDEENYRKAIPLFTSMAEKIREEDHSKLHFAMVIEGWEVELHGTLRGDTLRRVDKVIDETQANAFSSTSLIWNNGGIEIPVPQPDDNVIFVFTHIIQHFFDIGIGLRQICDWCRLMWIYRDSIDVSLLKSRLQRMKLMTEWKAFAAFAVDYLGMPADAMPLYSPSEKWKRKAARIATLIIKWGNLGHNKDFSHQSKYPFLIYKAMSFCMRTRDAVKVCAVFPIDGLTAWCANLRRRSKVTMAGK